METENVEKSRGSNRLLRTSTDEKVLVITEQEMIEESAVKDKNKRTNLYRVQ